MNEQERRALMAGEFAARFTGAPTVWVQSPGRVDLMGSHTDYNLGYVLTMTINRTTWIAARPRDDRQVIVHSLNVDGQAVFSLDDISFDAAAPWSNYVRGVAAVFQAEGYPSRGFEGLVHSTIPISSGLSSSAALEVAAATLFRVLCGWEIDPVRLALLCQRAENSFVGVNCGILDQYTVAMGRADHALVLDCRDLTSRASLIAPGIQVVICDTCTRRELAGSEYAQRRAQCEEGAARLAQFYPGVKALRDVTPVQLDAHRADLPDVVMRRCRFIVEESQRVLDMADALSRGDRAAIGRLAADSFVGARDLYEITSPEMLAMMDAMRGGPGIVGARQAGAGFGGCMVAFVERAQVDAFARHVEQAYRSATGIAPQVYAVQAVERAGPLG